MTGGLRSARGSAIILVMASITIVSLLGAALVSLSGTSLQSQLNTGNALRAFYLAESGLRFARLRPRPGNFFTVRTGEDGTFVLAVDDPPPAEPTPIPTNGFRVIRTGCKLESIGIVRSDSVFEAAQRLVVRSSNGMPCWDFDDSPFGTGFPDSCGTSVATIQGTAWEWAVCDGRPGGTLVLGGGDYLETDFYPFCEIGDGAPFTIRFWARPVAGFGGTVLGVGDGPNRFSVGLDGFGAWRWSYGNRSGGGIPADPGVWQRVTVLYDSARNEVRLQVASCPSGVRDRVNAYDGSAVIPDQSGTAVLFLGAENRNGSPADFFTGSVDAIDIVNAVELPDSPSLFCPGAEALAYYPLDRGTEDRSGPLAAGNGHDAAAFGGTLLAADRSGCPEGGFEFDGLGDQLRVADADALDPPAGGTLAAWIFPRSFREYAGLIHKGDLDSFADESYTLQFGGSELDTSSRQLRIGLTDDAGQVFFADSDILLSENTWYHVAATWDPFDAREMVLYVDGAPSGRVSLETMAGIRNSEGGLTIGAQLPATASFQLPYEGTMDDILIYPRPLSAEEVAFLAADGVPAGGGTP